MSLQKHQIGLAMALRRLARCGRLSSKVKVLLAGRRRDRVYSSVLPATLALAGVAPYVTFLGPVPNKDMVTLYHAVDALVLPSLWEGLPNAVLEAHACGLPAVVSHAANIDTLVLDGVSGFEVPTFNHAALADALEKMLALTATERREMGARGRRHVADQFGPERILRETVGLYDVLLAQKGLA
jgi:glycosyltransferase involved in cell wall biosynthesis